MDLKNYMEYLLIQDAGEKHRFLDIDTYKKKIQKVLELESLENIEENLLPALKQLEPFIPRPITVLFKVLSDVLYFEDRLPSSPLKDKMENEYFVKFGKNLCYSAQCLHRNLEVVLDNILQTTFINKNNQENVKELQEKLEAKKVDRKIVQWFNCQFPRHNLYFNSGDSGVKASEARKNVNERYSLELRNIQSERDLEEQEH